MIRLAAISFFFIIWSVAGNAQGPTKIIDYLNTAAKDQSLERFQAQMAFLDHNNYDLSWLSRLELRVGSEEGEFSANDYRLRVTPANPWQIRANKEFHAKQRTSVNSSYNVAIGEALKNRYDLLNEHWHQSKMLQLLEKRRYLISDFLTDIYQVGTSTIDQSELLKYDEMLTDLLLEINKTQMKVAELNYVVTLDLPQHQTFNWDSSDLIDTNEIYKRMTSMQNTGVNAQVQAEEDKLLLEEQSYQIEKSESRKNIGYIQSNIDSDKGDEFGDKIGFQIGVRIPILNPDRPNLQREKFEMLKQRNQVKEIKNSLDRKRDLIYLRLKYFIEEFKLINVRQEKSSQAIPIDDYGSDLLSFHMKQAIYNSKLQEKKLKTTSAVYKLYIEYLELNGMLSMTANTNYLSLKNE